MARTHSSPVFETAFLCATFIALPIIQVILAEPNEVFTWEGNMSAGKLNFVLAFVVGLLISEIVRDLLNVYDNRTNPTCPSSRDGMIDTALTVAALLIAVPIWYYTGYYGVLRMDVQIYSQTSATIVLTGRNVRAWTKARRQKL